MKKAKYLLLFIFLSLSSQAQDYLEALEEGKERYEQEQYYEAYLRFNAASIASKIQEADPSISQEAQDWLDKSVLGIQAELDKTDSLIQENQKVIEAFYFYDDRLALAYNGEKFGFVNKKGEVMIDYRYTAATPFDPEIGYARVEKDYYSYWLSPDGKEYSIRKATQEQELPLVEDGEIEINIQKKAEQKNLSIFKKEGSTNHHEALNEGIDLYNQNQYYEAYRRFHAVTYSPEKELSKLGKLLKDTTVYEIKQTNVKAEQVLNDTQRLLEAFYFYEDKFAIAYKEEQFYFINKKGEDVGFGKWEKAEQFDYWRRAGFAKVSRGGMDYYLDTLGKAYRVAYSIEDLSPEIKALDLSQRRLKSFSEELLEYPNLEVLILNRNFKLKKIPTEISKLQKLKILFLQYCGIKKLPESIGNLENLQYLNLWGNRLTTLPESIGNLKNLQVLYLLGNHISYEEQERIRKLLPNCRF